MSKAEMIQFIHKCPPVVVLLIFHSYILRVVLLELLGLLGLRAPLAYLPMRSALMEQHVQRVLVLDGPQELLDPLILRFLKEQQELRVLQGPLELRVLQGLQVPQDA